VIAVYAANGGRPDVIAKFFRQQPKTWVNEFAVIAADDVTILDRPFWKATEYMCKFADVPDSLVPAAKPLLRLAQMRTIAEDFSVTYHFGAAEVTDQNLRLHPKQAASELATLLKNNITKTLASRAPAVRNHRNPLPHWRLQWFPGISPQSLWAAPSSWDSLLQSVVVNCCRLASSRGLSIRHHRQLFKLSSNSALLGKIFQWKKSSSAAGRILSAGRAA